MSSRDKKTGLFILVLSLIQIILCDYQTIITEMDKKIQEKQANALLKSNSFQTLAQENNLLKLAFAESVQANSAAESSYRQYFNERNRCEGLSTDLGFIGKVASLPDDFCPPAPIAPEAVGLYEKLLQLDALQENITFAEQIFNQQKNFNVDVYDELSAYTRLREIALGPLLAAARKNGECLANFSTPSNPEPIECKAFAEAVTKAEAIYGKYRGKEVTFGMSTKGPVISLQMKNATYQRTKQQFNRLKTQIQPLINQFKSLQTTCQANLQNILSILNQRLSLARVTRQKIQTQNDKIAKVQSDLDTYLNKAKATTNTISNLATSLKNQFP